MPPTVQSVNPHFRALRITPNEAGGLWTYVSIGGWWSTAEDDPGLEFVLALPMADARAIELLAMAVYYNRTEALGLGHTVFIGTRGYKAHAASIC